MGLDVTAYSHLAPVETHTCGWCTLEDEHGDLAHIKAFAYDCFPASFAGIPIVGKLSGEFLDGGCYTCTDKTQVYDFHAGSSSGYTLWRDNLAHQFNPWRDGDVHGEPDPELPFYELIWFADNEGCIGPEAAFHLLDDFRVHRAVYVPCTAVGEGAGGRPLKYDDWLRAFELAADGGLVRFH